MSNTTQVEIHGVKLELDLRTARRIETLQVGTRVKVLKKEYGDNFKVLHGVVVGFEPFKELPTIIVAVCELDYSEAKIGFVYYNSKTKDVEIVATSENDIVALDKGDFISKIDGQIAKKQLEITELENRKQYFLDKFQQYWVPIEQDVADATFGAEEL